MLIFSFSVDDDAHRLARPMLLLLLLLGAALAGPTLGCGDAADSEPLLACGTRGDPAGNSTQVIAIFKFVGGVCGQLGEAFTAGGLLPSTCKSVGCQRATALASTSPAIASWALRSSRSSIRW